MRVDPIPEVPDEARCEQQALSEARIARQGKLRSGEDAGDPQVLGPREQLNCKLANFVPVGLFPTDHCLGLGVKRARCTCRQPFKCGQIGVLGVFTNRVSVGNRLGQAINVNHASNLGLSGFGPESRTPPIMLAESKAWALIGAQASSESTIHPRTNPITDPQFRPFASQETTEYSGFYQAASADQRNRDPVATPGKKQGGADGQFGTGLGS